jgi:hypothetical protein
MSFWIQLFGTLIGALLGCSLFARFGGYYTEKGKQLATHEDVANVLEQVRAVTRETETIKAQIGTELWSQQTIWNAKRDLYANVVESIEAAKTKLLSIGFRWTKETVSVTQAQFRSELYPAFEKFSHYWALSEIFLNPQANDAFEAFRTSLETFEVTAGEQFVPDPFIDQFINALNALRRNLIVAARKDLNIKG